MTNAPNDLREMWADAYRLFDINYKMPNTDEAWKRFWEQAQSLLNKTSDENNRFLFRMINMVAEMIEDRMKIEMGILPRKFSLEDMKLF